MQRMPLLVPLHDLPCQRDLLPYCKHECLASPSSTSGSPSNTTNILTRVTRIVKEDHMIYSSKINPTRCSEIQYKESKTEPINVTNQRQDEVTSVTVEWLTRQVKMEDRSPNLSNS